MARVVMMKNYRTGVVKKGFYGFSWTSFFFGGLVGIVRGDVIPGFVVLLVDILLGAIAAVSVFAWLIFWAFVIIWAFIYNKRYTTGLLEQGYEFSDDPSIEAAARAKLGVERIDNPSTG